MKISTEDCVVFIRLHDDQKHRWLVAALTREGHNRVIV